MNRQISAVFVPQSRCERVVSGGGTGLYTQGVDHVYRVCSGSAGLVAIPGGPPLICADDSAVNTRPPEVHHTGYSVTLLSAD